MYSMFIRLYLFFLFLTVHTIFQIGPVPAITEVLKKAGLTLKDMDLVEVRVFNMDSGVAGVFRRNTTLGVFLVTTR